MIESAIYYCLDCSPVDMTNRYLIGIDEVNKHSQLTGHTHILEVKKAEKVLEK